MHEEQTDEVSLSNRTPWSNVGARSVHPWHAMCSYLGSFPGSLARGIIALLSKPGDTVLDPFSGRGTTLLESRLLQRFPIASDLNPISLALSSAKNLDIDLETACEEIAQLRSGYDRLNYLPEAQVQHDDIQLIFHPETLAQLCFLRRRLIGTSQKPVRIFLLGALLGAMHGAERKDGTSAYASISMPNTFSMSPNYVKRFVQTNRLNRRARDVFEILNAKVLRLFREPPPNGHNGIVVNCNAKDLPSHSAVQSHLGKVTLILTSPPYLDVVNYAKQNWIRNWLLTPENYRGDDELLDDDLLLQGWIGFMESVLTGMKQMLSESGVIALVVGDVATAKGNVSLAQQLIQRVIHQSTFRYVGCFDDKLGHAIKTTRIWGDTKGKATDTDRIILLSDIEPELDFDALKNALIVKDEVLAGVQFPSAAELRKKAEELAGISENSANRHLQ